LRFTWVRADTAANGGEGIEIGDFPPCQLEGLLVGSPVSFRLSYRGDPAPDIGFIRAVRNTGWRFFGVLRPKRTDFYRFTVSCVDMPVILACHPMGRNGNALIFSLKKNGSG